MNDAAGKGRHGGAGDGRGSRGGRGGPSGRGGGKLSGKGRPGGGGSSPGGRSGRSLSGSAPPPRLTSKPRPPKPALPDDKPRLRRDIRADLAAASAPGEVDDLARAVTAAADALAAGDLDRALELLTWAKAAAPRSAVVRETLGIAAYHAGDFAQAHRELLAYRRLTTRQDQNHLLADAARAIGKADKVGEYVREMAAADGVPPDRLVEAYIVLSGAWADRGDLRGALGVLERLDLDPDEVESWHPRVWYAAGDLCERMGDRERARDFFEAITAVTEEFLDVDERLAALEN